MSFVNIGFYCTFSGMQTGAIKATSCTYKSSTDKSNSSPSIKIMTAIQVEVL